MIKPLVFLLSICMISPVLAHGGRTNSQGCHNERATGTYHCHGNPSKSFGPKIKDPSTRTSLENSLKAPGVNPSLKLTPSAQVYIAPEETPTASFYFSNCNQAHAAGKAPLRTHQEGYRSELDSNQDLVACGPGDE